MREMTAILANGDFPAMGGKAWALMASAARIVACDGAGARLKALSRRQPNAAELPPIFTIGDGDSGEVDLKIQEQETNDLEKAYRYCLAHGWRDITIFGAGGGREDHALGNIFRALEWGVDVVGDFGTFHALSPENSPLALKTEKGRAISVFAADPDTRMASDGLEWPLDGVKFKSLYCATLNRAAKDDVVLSADRKVFVYVAEA
ncbi:MAG: hypothetical protein II909_01060 [Kiritimatiellae bacterium]|nr:hypothetical protein [Kiritimatiellia bacterium]